MLGISLCSLRRAGLFAICLSFLRLLANNVKRADSDGHIISYVLKYFLDGGTYQLPEARRESDSLHPSIFFIKESFIKVFIKKIVCKKIFAVKSVSGLTSLTDACFDFLQRQLFDKMLCWTVRKIETEGFFTRSWRNPRTLKSARNGDGRRDRTYECIL